jgi:hypothetical protein
MLRIFSESPPQARDLDLEGFLRWLGGPALFHLRGERSDRCRVLVGGLHGNEPSGFYAIHRILRDPPPLPVDVALVLGNVPAALYDVPFSHRFVPGGEDMNRVWGRLEGTGLREDAGRILERLSELPVESVVDLHNNTGHNPIYAVVLEPSAAHVSLARHWTERFVLYGGGELGTLLERLIPRAPGVVIECGQAGDPAADLRAAAGARSYLGAPEPGHPSGLTGARGYRSVARILVPEDVQLAFSEGRTVADLTISPSIDRHNFRVMEPGMRLAYWNGRGRLVVLANDGHEASDEYLEVRDGAIYLRRPVVPVMMTTDAMAAKSDCLLYAAEVLPLDEEAPAGEE